MPDLADGAAITIVSKHVELMLKTRVFSLRRPGDYGVCQLSSPRGFNKGQVNRIAVRVGHLDGIGIGVLVGLRLMVGEYADQEQYDTAA
jgi:hypothetical protein